MDKTQIEQRVRDIVQGEWGLCVMDTRYNSVSNCIDEVTPIVTEVVETCDAQFGDDGTKIAEKDICINKNVYGKTKPLLDRYNSLLIKAKVEEYCTAHSSIPNCPEQVTPIVTRVARSCGSEYSSETQIAQKDSCIDENVTEESKRLLELYDLSDPLKKAKVEKVCADSSFASIPDCVGEITPIVTKAMKSCTIKFPDPAQIVEKDSCIDRGVTGESRRLFGLYTNEQNLNILANMLEMSNELNRLYLEVENSGVIDDETKAAISDAEKKLNELGEFKFSGDTDTLTKLRESYSNLKDQMDRVKDAAAILKRHNKRQLDVTSSYAVVANSYDFFRLGLGFSIPVSSRLFIRPSADLLITSDFSSPKIVQWRIDPKTGEQVVERTTDDRITQTDMGFDGGLSLGIMLHNGRDFASFLRTGAFFGRKYSQRDASNSETFGIFDGELEFRTGAGGGIFIGGGVFGDLTNNEWDPMFQSGLRASY